MHDYEARAKSAGLSYIQDMESGYSRRKCGKGFKFIDSSAKTIADKKVRERILSLVIPPAWKDVWICPDEDGHIQVTGIDDAGRKQYIYHPRWHEASAAHKYGRLKQFAGLLPSIRKRVLTDLKLPDLSKRRVVAAVVRLLDKACIRIGNKQYMDANGSHGATTLLADHVSAGKDGISFNFKGKSGKQIELKCNDDELKKVIEDCQKSDGEFLFSYNNDNEEPVAVTSCDVNAYLLEVSKHPVTAKDFRTWRASVLALNLLCQMQEDLSKTAKKRFIAGAVKEVSAALANTPAVCRQSYIHSSILISAEGEILPGLMKELAPLFSRRSGLNSQEARLVAFLTHIENDNVTSLTVKRASKERAA